MLADAAMMIAVLTTAPAGTGIAALDLKANFLRPVSGDGRDLTARAVVERTGPHAGDLAGAESRTPTASR